jgi:toxin ParE1/3/4
VKRPVRLRGAAENDVAGHALYLQNSSVEAAVRFLDAFDATIALLGRSPEIGGTCRFQNRLFDGFRVWPIAGFKSHLIFYRILPDEIEVVRVIHGARDLKSIFGEGEL